MPMSARWRSCRLAFPAPTLEGEPLIYDADNKDSWEKLRPWLQEAIKAQKTEDDPPEQRGDVHHVTSDGFQRITRSHARVIPLCPRHHLIQHGPRESIEALGHAGFAATYQIAPLAFADALWAISMDAERFAA
jgi:hypothetical protein